MLYHPDGCMVLFSSSLHHDEEAASVSPASICQSINHLIRQSSCIWPHADEKESKFKDCDPFVLVLLFGSR